MPVKPGAGTLAELAEATGKGQVETLVILGGNPAYDAPADLEFAALMKRVKTTIRLGLHADETSREATWHLPAAHYLESWGDARTGDGTVVPIQPLIEPLDRRSNGARGGCPAGRVRDDVALRDRPPRVPEGERRRRRRLRGRLAEFPPRWAAPGSAYPVVTPALKWDSIARAVAAAQAGSRSALGRSPRAGPGPRCQGRRRPVRQQRLAARAPRPGLQADLG